MNLKIYFSDIFSKKFRNDKHKSFFYSQLLVIVSCSLLNSLWLIKDIFIKGLGPEGNLFLLSLSRLIPSILLIPFIGLSFYNKKLESFFANALMYINILAQVFALHFSGAPSGGTGHMIMSLVIFLLHYASASGISQIVAQILYPFLMYFCSQAGLGFFTLSSNPTSLLFSNIIMSMACILAALILRINYYGSWITKCKFEQMSKIDPMTSLWNRKRISDITNKDLLLNDSTILMVDIDNFKSFNDNNGHDFGDQVIYDTVTYLRKSFPSADIIRFGGDEFLIVASEVIKLQKIKIRLSSNVARNDITYSIGVAYGHINDNIYSIIKHADIALYRSKETKNCITSFDSLLN